MPLPSLFKTHESLQMDHESESTEKSGQSESSQPINEDAGKLLLRISVAGLMLFHGVAKLTVGVGAIEEMLAGVGLPATLAYGVYIGEVLAPLLMLVGILTRVSSAIFAFNMLVATLLGHGDELFSLNQYGGWAIELPVLYLLGGVCVALIGPGRFAIYPGRG
jgi:putative oxidoreductase